MVRRLEPFLAALGGSFAMRGRIVVSREINAKSPFDVTRRLFGKTYNNVFRRKDHNSVWSICTLYNLRITPRNPVQGLLSGRLKPTSTPLSQSAEYRRYICYEKLLLAVAFFSPSVLRLGCGL